MTSCHRGAGTTGGGSAGGDVLAWLGDDELARIPTSDFWNEEKLEVRKAFDIRDGNIDKLWRHLRETTTCYQEYEAVVRLARELGREVRGVGLDIAAGVCWTSALLSKLEAVTRLYAVDISRHRLLKLAPLVLAAFGADPAKVVRALGNFCDIRLPDGSVDFCLMAQAFHHADDPRRLMRELHRVLKPGAPALIIGEEPVYPRDLLIARCKNLVKMVLPRSCYSTKPVYKPRPSFEALYPADPDTGDRYYRIDEYENIFTECGFTLHRRRRSRYTVFVGVRS